jgi:hypothetical protein
MTRATEPQKHLGLTDVEKAALMSLYQARAFLDISIADYQRGLEKTLESHAQASPGAKLLLELMKIQRELAEDIRRRVLPILAARRTEASLSKMPANVISIDSVRPVTQ